MPPIFFLIKHYKVSFRIATTYQHFQSHLSKYTPYNIQTRPFNIKFTDLYDLMIHLPKPLTWDTRDKRNIEAFLSEYEAYCDASGYIGNEVRMRSFGPFIKEGASIAFAAWRGSRGEDLPWAALKAWAVDVWRKPSQHLLDVTALGAMKWPNEQNLSRMLKSIKLSTCNWIVRRIRNSE